jgi:hypothetical protein
MERAKYMDTPNKYELAIKGVVIVIYQTVGVPQWAYAGCYLCTRKEPRAAIEHWRVQPIAFGRHSKKYVF